MTVWKVIVDLSKLQIIRRFFRIESLSSVLLMTGAVLALVLANSPWKAHYTALLDMPWVLKAAGVGFEGPLLLWINDGLMSLFFLLVSLEIKREMLYGHLASPRQAMLPVLAALGGVAVPALIYAWVNVEDAHALRGWAIPSATDIAFSLGVLTLLGRRVPVSLKIFVTALAVIDDLAAIVIIALFYTARLHWTALAVAAAGLLVLFVLNRRRVRRLSPYLAVGFVMWAAVLASGVHATIGGVLLGLFIPASRSAELKTHWGSPLERLEDNLHPWVAYAVMPIFAFANAGLPLMGLELRSLLDPVPLGIAVGLVLGKPLGIVGVSAACIVMNIAPMPEGANWRSLCAVGMVAGIGFTMSLFIAGLAFPGNAMLADEARLGILAGSLLSALLGYGMFRMMKPAA